MTLSRDPAKARAWQERSRARAAAKPRTAAPLTRKAKGVKPRSDKRARDMVERRALVVSMLGEFPRCQARWLCSGARSVDVHERLSRARGGSILDPVQAHMMTVCRKCHTYLTEHPAEADRRRLLLPSWHRCPPVGPC